MPNVFVGSKLKKKFMEVYNKMSSRYDKMYKENIENFQDKLKHLRNSDARFVDFYPTLGIRTNETCDLLFLGQAVNGWGTGFDLYKPLPENKIDESIAFSNGYFSKLNHSPLDWVNVIWSNSTYNAMMQDDDARKFYSEIATYRTYRSFFWNVVFKLTSDFYGYDRKCWHWSKKVVWSNLYKIAERRANPSWFLREQQLITSAELIRQEIEELKPKYCIILTNYEWWKPFQELLRTRPTSFDTSLNNIESVECYLDTKIIITTRPRYGNSERHVEQIKKVF